VFTVFGVGLPVFGSRVFTDYLFTELESVFGGMWAVEPDPGKMAALIMDHINRKRNKLGIEQGKERILYDMEMRRELAV
jgi:anaerobic carbon-monoxide dehydrogenase catalytic subunit